MKAAVFYEPKDIRVEEVPEPTIAEDEVLVEVSACGFCGSDVEYYYGKSPVGTATGKGPLVLGHEFSGKVVGLGKVAGNYGLQEGDRVAVCPIQSCGACNSCRAGKPQFCANLSVLGVTTDGGFAQFAKTKAAHAYKLPDTLTRRAGGVRRDARGRRQRGAQGRGRARRLRGRLRSRARSGSRWCSCSGTRERASRSSAPVATGSTWRRSSAPTSCFESGDDLADRVREANGGNLADRVIVATGSMGANQQALEISGPGSTVIYMGVTGPQDAVQLPMLTSLIQDKTIRFSLWYPFQWPRTISMLAHAEVDTGPIITHSAPLDGIGAAIDRVVGQERRGAEDDDQAVTGSGELEPST